MQSYNVFCKYLYVALKINIIAYLLNFYLTIIDKFLNALFRYQK